MTHDHLRKLPIVDIMPTLAMLAAAFAVQNALADTIPITGTPQALAVCDINNDGRSDLAVACSSPNQILLFLATEEGALGEPTAIQNTLTPTGLVAMDLDGDGDEELVLRGGRLIQTYMNDDGEYKRGPRLTLPLDSSGSMVPLDIDRDEDLDLALRVGQHVMFLRNDLHKLLVTQPLMRLQRGTAFALIDVGGEGQDLVIGDENLTVLVGADAAYQALSEPVEWPVLDPSSALASGDLDHDGDPEVVSVRGAWLGVFENIDGRFTAAAHVWLDRADPAVDVRAQDCDGDGHPDLAVLSRVNERTSFLDVFTGGMYTLDEPGIREAVSVGYPKAFVLLDLLGDGILDAAVIGSESEIAIVRDVAGTQSP